MCFRKAKMPKQIFTEPSAAILAKLTQLNLTIPLGLLDSTYSYVGLEEWNDLLIELALKSNIYKSEVFDCDDIAFKVYVLCRERYGLNGLGVVMGDTPQGYHAWNAVYHGDGFHYFEGNEGFGYGGIFPAGEHGYIPKVVVL